MILDLQVHILKRLPRNARAGTARLLSRYYASLFEDEINIYEDDGDLPDEVLHRLYEHADCERLTRARAGVGDLRQMRNLYVKWQAQTPLLDKKMYEVEGCHPKVTEWLRGQEPPCPWDEETCIVAAEGGHLEVLKWLRAQDPPCPWYEDYTCEYAARGGYLEVLKWLRSQEPRCHWNEKTCSGAALGGHLEVLKWLRSQEPPCPWNEECSYRAAYEGHLEVLKWMRAQDPPCPWDEKTCRGAARGGQLEVLKWLREQEQPCPWDPETILLICYDLSGEMRAWILHHM